jgi:hypothetical protein
MICKGFWSSRRFLWITLWATPQKRRQIIDAAAFGAVCAVLLHSRRINEIKHLAEFHEICMVRRGMHAPESNENKKWG